MRLFLICLSLALSGASVRASTPNCAPIFWPVTHLEPDTERAWVRLFDGLRALSQNDVVPDLLTWVRQKRFGWTTFRDGRALATRAMADHERAYLCHALTPLLLETDAVNLDAELTFYLLDQFCGLGESDVLAVTEGALRATESAQTRRWLDLLADARTGRRRTPVLSPARWQSLLRKSDAPVMTHFVRDRYADLGLSEDDLVWAARRLIRAGRSVAFALDGTGLPRGRAAELIPDLDAMQWIEYRHVLGQLNDAAVDALHGPARPRRTPEAGYVHHVLSAALYDEAVPYDVFERVLDVSKQYWRHGSNEPLPVLPFTPPDKLSPGQLERAESFFGTATVRPQLVARNGRQFARAIERHSLNRVVFDDADDFVDVFALKRHTSFPVTGEDGQFDPKTLQEARAMAHVYFRRLRRELPKFLAFEPTTEQIKWLLETPLQFAPAPLHLDVDPRPGWQRKIRFEEGRYDTAEVILQLQRQALDWAMPRVQTLDEWRSLLEARRLPALSNQVTRRGNVNRYFFEAARVGPADLSWLDIPLVAQATVPVQVLGDLRESVPLGLRTDERVMARAIETLVDQERGPDSILPSRRDQVLFDYLFARTRAGALTHIRPRALNRLRALAFQHGYGIDEQARDFASVAIRFERRQR